MTNGKEVKDDDLISLVEFHQFMFHNIVPIEDLDDYEGKTLSKMLPFWRRKKLLPFIKVGEHIKISFAELIWLRILDTLRQLSYPVSLTNIVCDYFFKDAHENDLPKKNFYVNKEQLLKKKQTSFLTDEEEEILRFVEEGLKDEVLMTILKSDVNYLTNLVISCIKNGEERKILIFPDGRVAESHLSEIRTHRKYEIDETEPHIELSITYYLKEFIKNEQLLLLLMPQLLDDRAKQVLKEIRDRNVKEITIQMKDGNITNMTRVRRGMITGEQAMQIKNILGLRNYQRITLDTLDNNRYVITKTDKKI